MPPGLKPPVYPAVSVEQHPASSDGDGGCRDMPVIRRAVERVLEGVKFRPYPLDGSRLSGIARRVGTKCRQNAGRAVVGA